jgi:tRNA-splicing ligase RtcB
MKDERLEQIDTQRYRIVNRFDIDATLFAAPEVPIESAAVDELATMLEVQETVDNMAKADSSIFDERPEVLQVAITPDFHKARGIPVGTVMATKGFSIPQAIGNDVNCGMRLHITGLSEEAVMSKINSLESQFRRKYFEGGRDIPMTRSQRTALLTEGLEGLFNELPRSEDKGLWRVVHQHKMDQQLDHIDRRGSLKAGIPTALDSWLGPADRISRDSQIGSIGGGNHFVEIQRVERILDGTIAHLWGIKAGAIVVMVHSGSLALGHVSGGLARDAVRSAYPSSLNHPNNGIFVLPDGPRHAVLATKVHDSLRHAANFAFANRMLLATMAIDCLEQECGEFESNLLYDAPHNYWWQEENASVKVTVHRKGACPARGYDQLAGSIFECTGEPVLVPGSMGASSFILAGRGLEESLMSASHGAGRQLARGEAMRGYEEEFKSFMERFRVVTPIDLRRVDVRSRKDILERKLDEIRQEAPYAYKGIGPIIETLTDTGMAKTVAELVPLMTIKG